MGPNGRGQRPEGEQREPPVRCTAWFGAPLERSIWLKTLRSIYCTRREAKSRSAFSCAMRLAVAGVI
jgi:hypothetical protein